MPKKLRLPKIIRRILLFGLLAFPVWWMASFLIFRYQNPPITVASGSRLSQNASSLAQQTDRVLLVTFDALRYDHLSAYGYNRLTSPNIDALAQRSYVFNQAVTTASWTFPSIVSIATGTVPRTHGFADPGSEIHDEVRFPVRCLSESGINTALYFAHQVIKANTGFRKFHSRLGTTAQELTDWSMDWLAENGHESFLLWLHYFEPHHPYVPPDSIPLPPPANSAGPTDLALSSLICPRKPKIGDFSPLYLLNNRQETSFYIDSYDRYIRYADQEFGRLLDYVLSQTWAENCVIIFTADHGESFGEHGSIEHANLPYEDQIRVPLIVHPGKGLDQRKDFFEPVSLIDIMPTICALFDVGCPKIKTMEGRSLLPLFEGGRLKTRIQFSETKEISLKSLACMRSGSYKVMYNGDKDEPLFYFNLVDDPCELDPSKITIVELLRRPEIAYLTWQLLRQLDKPPSGKAELDPEVRKALKSLGYLN